MSFEKVDPKASFPEIERKILKFWEKEKIFDKSLSKNKKGERFVFYEGPPTANGHPGIHHVLARAFKDAVPRYKTMRGYLVDRKAGWDTHGLPVELEIEKKLGISGKPEIESLKKTPEESIRYFNEQCRESVWEYKTEWEEMTRRMAFWVDMNDPYVTYENNYIESVWWVISQSYQKNLLYKGHKVVPYCPRCGTALSSHEVAQGYKDVTENSVYLKFRLKPGQKVGSWTTEGNTYILSWTTTPWTLPGNVALAVGKNIEYVLVESNRARYIMARNLVEKVIQENHKIEEKIAGDSLVGLKYEPLFPGAIPDSTANYKNAFQVYPADFVTIDDGTGVVHTAVMYGIEDYDLGQKIGLPQHHTVDYEGNFEFVDIDNGILKDLNGEFTKDQNTEKTIVEYLEEKGNLLRSEPHTHTYPFCWRCESPLLYYAKNSWFIAMSKLKQEMVEGNNQIGWTPSHIQKGRFGEWLEGVKDWAISRDRYWGTPLPVWECQSDSQKSKKCKPLVISSIEELKERAINFKKIYKNEKSIDLHRPYIDELEIECECGKTMKRTPEVLDTWLDSGSMPFAQWHYPFENKTKIDSGEFYPADFISEAIDQTRGWFYTLHAVANITGHPLVYRNVICLGHVLDEKGLKMSKSKGNVIDPIEMADSHGFDAIRWYFYTNNQPGEPKLMGENDIKDQVRRFILILWNTYSFFVTYANLADISVKDLRSHKATNVFDKWLISRKNQTIKKITESMDKYDIFTATRTCEDFVIELSTWYVRRNKKRQDRDFLAILYDALVDVSKLLAPFVPFVSEEMYQNLTKEDSVHLSQWPEYTERLIDEKLENQMKVTRQVIELGHAIRKEEAIRSRQPLNEVQIVKSKLPKELLAIISDELNVKKIENVEKESDGKGWIMKEEGELKIALYTNISKELKLEGVKNDVVRLIQDARKEARYAFSDVAKCSYSTSSVDIKKAIGEYEKEIKKQTILSEIEKNSLDTGDVEVDGKIDGKEIKIILAK